MLNNILSHTPLYVWALLAFLVARGVVALREREIAVAKLFIVPLAMLALALQDIVVKFGPHALAFGAWCATALASALLAMKFSRTLLALGTTPGTVRVGGSVLPLAMMLILFAAKYALAVALAIAPQLRGDASAMFAACALFGALNGCFLGRLAADVSAYRALRVQDARCAALVA